MSYGMSQLGSHALNRGQDSSYSQNDADEAEYDRLRALARQEQDRRHDLIAQSRAAYDQGDGAAAKQLSNEAKKHEANADKYNRQASDFIFRANNANCPEDVIDLHGLYVEEAERVLEMRLQAAQRSGATGLHIIVGRGNHSTNHVQKLKPAVERLCRERNLEYSTESNAGRIYVSFDGQGVGEVSSSHHSQAYHHGPQGGGNGHHGQQQHHQQQQQHGQQNQLDDIAINIGKQAAPKILKKLQGCCVVM